MDVTPPRPSSVQKDSFTIWKVPPSHSTTTVAAFPILLLFSMSGLSPRTEARNIVKIMADRRAHGRVLE